MNNKKSTRTQLPNINIRPVLETAGDPTYKKIAVGCRAPKTTRMLVLLEFASYILFFRVIHVFFFKYNRFASLFHLFYIQHICIFCDRFSARKRVRKNLNPKEIQKYFF